MLLILKQFFCRHAWMEPASRDTVNMRGITATMWVNCRKCGTHLSVDGMMPGRGERIEVRLEARRVLTDQLRHESYWQTRRWWRFL